MPLLYYIVWCCEKLKFLHISFLKTAHFVFAIIRPFVDRMYFVRLLYPTSECEVLTMWEFSIFRIHAICIAEHTSVRKSALKFV